MSVAQTTESRKVGKSANKQLEKIRKETIINQLEALRRKRKGKPTVHGCRLASNQPNVSKVMQLQPTPAVTSYVNQLRNQDQLDLRI